MEFAKKQLEKYGWTEGKGLGKYETGISEPLKPKLKRSVTGIGHDAASDFNDQWWTTLYNKAASNIQIKEKNGKTKKIKTKNSTKFEISNNTWKLNASKKLKQAQYGDNFIKTAVLSNGGVKIEKVVQSESEDEDQCKIVSAMTDEELLAACEGRTGHKGARHGLKALGKLARIERQEEILLKLPQYQGYSHVKKNESNENKESDKFLVVDKYSNKSSKKKGNKSMKKESKTINDTFDSHEIETNNTEDNLTTVTKSQSEHIKKYVQTLNVNDISNGNLTSSINKRKKKKYKN